MELCQPYWCGSPEGIVMCDTIIKNANIVTEEGVIEGFLEITDGKISKISGGEYFDTENAEDTKGNCTSKKSNKPLVIDAAGNFLLPGGIDVHTHLEMPLRDDLWSADSWESGTIAAAVGGTTTVVDYACQDANGTLTDALNVWKNRAKKACVDYGLHMSVVKTDDATLSEMADMVNEGVTSFKVYLVYDMRVSDEELMKILERSKELGTIVTVHCENYGVIKHRTEKLLAEGKTEPKYHAISRPDICEGEAVNRVIKVAKMADDAPVYIVHNSCEAGVKRIVEAQAEGQAVYAETCPQYLLLDESRYELPDFEGAKYVMSPPLRNVSNNKYLWNRVKDGTICVVATDHCPFFFEEKKLGLHNFSMIPNGGTGIEERIPLMYSEGRRNGLDFAGIAKVTSTNPAKMFGMYPKKGTIKEGSDADLVIYDPKACVRLTHDILHEHVDYTCYEGFELEGFPVMTLLRGEVVAKDGEYVGEKGCGEYVVRQKPLFSIEYC